MVLNCDVLKVMVLFEWILIIVMILIYVYVIGNIVVEFDENLMELFLFSLKVVKIKYMCILDNV